MISQPNSVAPSGDPESFTLLSEAGKPPQNFSGQDLSNRDFNHRDLAGMLFNGSDLNHAQLKGANLQDVQLCGANLTEAKLCGAQLPGAKLNGADLGRANLTGADLTGADLRRADFNRAELRDANFSNANVQGANFNGSSGLSDEAKLDLKNRGATFNHSVHSPDVKWWVQFVVVPIAVAVLGSSGLFAVFVARQPNSSAPLLPAQISPSAASAPVEKP
ncbi:pentapeptide repeat-containing protein [Oscillatoria sp. FACHB-1406]|uniref:pentapeptide repeat-containing protein n=1 Tax=Oscillatoria sp. FACHB-1406 TaxID=2692846 RepID=UPI0016862FBB|nr:pentapeptide repeat-containing protein [Oscillatoria sp. FACHB-1406]MBD2580140.1 pentapeptide repeat-containing protein [Oscillatoria sp. FACHB-1406]